MKTYINYLIQSVFIVNRYVVALKLCATSEINVSFFETIGFVRAISS